MEITEGVLQKMHNLLHITGRPPSGWNLCPPVWWREGGGQHSSAQSLSQSGIKWQKSQRALTVTEGLDFSSVGELGAAGVDLMSRFKG